MKSNRKENRVAHQKPIRLWPGILLVIVQWLISIILPRVIPVPEMIMYGLLGGLFLGLMIIVWWLFFSRTPRLERWITLIFIIVVMFATSFFIDESIITGNMGLMYIFHAVPVMCLALVAWATVTCHLSNTTRRFALIITILLASGAWILLRTDGIDGAGLPDFNWRWASTHEDRMLEKADYGSSEKPSIKVTLAPAAEWPGFRGPDRDGIIKGIQIESDWEKETPEELWRKPVGPGCSSFAISGKLFFTQEQRGEYEIVSCYDLLSGEPVWQHSDEVRFWDSHAGAGPRSTPTLVGNRVYTLGGTGILNSLDARTGSLLWSRDAAADAGVNVLTWGFTGSPLVVNDAVIVALAGKLVAYDTLNGQPLWFGPDGGSSYSSPQLLTLSGIPQVLMMSGTGVIGVEPASGEILWEYPWPKADHILQPAYIENNDLLLSDEYKGIRRISVTWNGDEYSTEEVWISSEMNVNFNDHVINKGYAYGFNGPALACIDLSNGKRLWKGDRYRGWLLLLADQDLLLVLSERGKLALVRATPEKFTELAQLKAIDGKTWNHPALAGDVLLVRNSREMAAFRLPLAGN